MSTSNQKEPAEREVPENSAPALPAEFFSELLEQPLCRRTGECDNCGKCRH